MQFRIYPETETPEIKEMQEPSETVHYERQIMYSYSSTFVCAVYRDLVIADHRWAATKFPDKDNQNDSDTLCNAWNEPNE